MKKIEADTAKRAFSEHIEERKLDLATRELDLKDKELTRPAPESPPPIPADILSSTMSESEPWAKEQKLAAIYELYHQVQDWDRVRHVMTLRGQL